MHVREETPADAAGIRAVHLAAFEGSAEADLVDALRTGARPLVSLVAEDGGAIAGHVLFSPATLDGADDLRLMGLAPMAVAPGRQRQGLGARLVADGLARCRDLGIDGVVVLGHARYYPRFGFVPASRLGLRTTYDVPDDAFMALALRPAAFTGRSGLIRYHPVFAAS